MELTVIATSMALSIGLGLLSTHLMMSMVFSLMTHSVARAQRSRTVELSPERYRHTR